MAEFSVWAPRAHSVEVEVDGRRVPMRPGSRGRWTVEVPEAGPGSDYAFRCDGGEPRPDPRSLWQPRGVHGFSRLIDLRAFPWTDAGWCARPLSSGVIYELHVGTFTPEGTFRGAIDRLDQLAELGVTYVEIMPVAQFSGERGWGYDGVDFFAPHHAYGGPEGLMALVDACHARGLAVLLDVVYNHFGPEGAYAGQFAPYLTSRHCSPWGDAINYDGPGSDEVRTFFLDNALMWLRDYHMDGLRLDAVHTLLDTSAKHFLEQLAEEVSALEAHLGRSLILIAESDLNDPRIVRSREAGGYGIHAQWIDDFRHALHTVLTGERTGFHGDFGRLADLATSLQQGYVYCGRYSPHRDRCHGRPPVGISGDRFVAFLQNHDQVGNRAGGERSSHLLSPDLLRVAAAWVMLSPFTPMLFQGEEWGASTPFLYFTDHSEPELARSVSEGRRNDFAAFGWNWDDVPDPQDPETFRRSKLDWSERDRPEHAALMDWHRRLIALRRACPDLTDPRFDRVRVRFDEDARWIALRRNRVTVAANFAPEVRTVPLDDPVRPDPLLASKDGFELNGAALRLPPESVVVLLNR